MTGRSSSRRRIAALALLVSGLPLLVACSIKSPGTTSPQQQEPSLGPLGSAGSQTIPAAP